MAVSVLGAACAWCFWPRNSLAIISVLRWYFVMIAVSYGGMVLVELLFRVHTTDPTYAWWRSVTLRGVHIIALVAVLRAAVRNR